MSHLNLTQPPDYSKMTPAEIEAEVLRYSRCSALVRVTDDLSDLYAGHATWWNLGTLLRIYKQISLPLPPSALEDERNTKKTKTVDAEGKETVSSTAYRMHTESFSSYPGVLSSQDDFYITTRAHVILQTTNNVYNTSLFPLVSADSLLSWHRVRLANTLAIDGDDWARLFRREASGTYPNQYMVVDLNKFTPGLPLADGLLYVVEEIPGLVEAKDMTQELARGYWPSYNVAYFEDVYRRSLRTVCLGARPRLFLRNVPSRSNFPAGRPACQHLSRLLGPPPVKRLRC